jgi:cellulose synthase/poly-beta-1,6-N-acetylglucosamine synthase-like glycosyltransferase
MFEMFEILRIIVLLFFAIPVFVFGSYGLIILYYGKIYKPKKTEKNLTQNTELPFVSVVTATHNEENIIKKKIDNLLATNYPKQKIELIFADDSSDLTPSIIKEYSLKYPNIHLIEFNKRMGYSPSMFAGVNASKGNIIVLSDAGSFHDGDTVSNLVRHFSDPMIGAVSGKDIILNTDEGVGNSEAFYLRILDLVRIAETNMDSTFYFKGEASAVRKNLISDLEDVSAAFDTATALSIRKKGYKTIFDPDAKFYEYAPKMRSERIKQKTTRAAHWIKILLSFRNMAFNNKYGKFGMLTMPANFGMLMVSPVSIFLGICSLVGLSFIDTFFAFYIWGLIGILALFSLIISRQLLSTFIDFEISLLNALYQIAFTKKKHDQIDTVLSTRR